MLRFVGFRSRYKIHGCILVASFYYLKSFIKLTCFYPECSLGMMMMIKVLPYSPHTKNSRLEKWRKVEVSHNISRQYIYIVALSLELMACNFFLQKYAVFLQHCLKVEFIASPLKTQRWSNF